MPGEAKAALALTASAAPSDIFEQYDHGLEDAESRVQSAMATMARMRQGLESQVEHYRQKCEARERELEESEARSTKLTNSIARMRQVRWGCAGRQITRRRYCLVTMPPVLSFRGQYLTVCCCGIVEIGWLVDLSPHL